MIEGIIYILQFLYWKFLCHTDMDQKELAFTLSILIMDAVAQTLYTSLRIPNGLFANSFTNIFQPCIITQIFVQI